MDHWRNKTLLLLDFSNLFFKAFYVHNKLEYRGVKTGGLYGVIQQLTSLLIEFKPDRLGVCSDAKPYFRTMELGTYKSDRKRLDADDSVLIDINRNRALCRQFFNLLGHPFMESRGLEADDLIAICAKNYYNHYDRMYVVSNDSDLYQLLDYDNLSIVTGVGKKRRIFTKREFSRDYSLRSASDWLMVTALTGGHNNLKGIRGVGEVTAIRMIIGKDKKHIDRYERIKHDYGELIETNLRVSALPYYGIRGSRKMRLPAITVYRPAKMMSFFRKYGIGMTQSMQSAFLDLHS